MRGFIFGFAASYTSVELLSIEMIKRGLGRGWHNDSARHGLAAKGIKTGRKRVVTSRLAPNKTSQPMLQRFYSSYRGEIEKLNERGRKENREWVADLDIRNGKLVLEDVNWGDEDDSHQSWDRDDFKSNHGYCHYHVSSALSGLSALDYIAVIDVHEDKEDKTLPTYLGLATDDRIEIWSCFLKDRRRELETISEKEDWKALAKLEKEMKASGEVVKVLDEPLGARR